MQRDLIFTMTENGKGQTGVFLAAGAATLVIVVLFSLWSGPDAAPREPELPLDAPQPRVEARGLGESGAIVQMFQPLDRPEARGSVSPPP